MTDEEDALKIKAPRFHRTVLLPSSVCSCVFVLVVTICLLYLVVLPGCRVHSAYVQLATLLKLVMSAILFLNALLCNKCVSDTPTHLLMMMLL